jgi:6-phosphogluconolactonase (cycloisomerase 2 family)
VGCVNDASVVYPGCGGVRALGGPERVVVSRDGRNVYALGGRQVAAFARDPNSGALAQLPGSAGCLVGDVRDPDGLDDDDNEGCRLVRGLNGDAPAMSPDDRQLYIASAFYDSDSIVTLSRSAADGALTQPPGPAGCASQSGLRQCRRGRGINNAAAVAVAPDGASVYVVSRDGSGTVARFARDGADGALRQPPDPRGCHSVALPIAFCARGRALQGGEDAVVSPDGRNLYVAGSDRGIASFARDRVTGALVQLPGRHGCVSRQTSTACEPARGIVPSYEPRLATSLNGRTLYATSDLGRTGAIAVLRRDPSTGRLRELRGRAGCLEGNRLVHIGHGETRIAKGNRAQCSPLRGLGSVGAIALSPDGRHAYALGYDEDNGDAIATLAIRGPSRRR